MDLFLGILAGLLVVLAVLFVAGGITAKPSAEEKKTDHVVAFSLMGLVAAVCAVAVAILAVLTLITSGK